MKSRLELLGHACFSIQEENKKLIVDPWIRGNCFNNGWSLRRDIQIETLNASEIDYVHITHEHPDHLNIESLKLLNTKWNPIFILQATKDRRIANFISNKLRRRVIELNDGEEYKLSEHMSIKVYTHGHMDSFSLIKLHEVYILNINDCVLKDRRSLRNIRRRIGNEPNIDILLSQYSFASYAGNKAEVLKIIKATRDHVNWVRERIAYFKPKIFIPFASHIRWCHEENVYLNKYSVKEKDLVKELESLIESKKILHSNNRKIELKSNELSLVIERSSDINDLILDSKTIKKEETNFNCLSEYRVLRDLTYAAEENKKRIKLKNGKLGIIFLKFLALIKYIKPVKIKCLLSNGRSINLILDSVLNFREANYKKSEDITLAADSLLYCLENDYGAETLWVNSRMEINSKDKKKLFKHFYLSILNNQGYLFPFGVIKFFIRRIILKKP